MAHCGHTFEPDLSQLSMLELCEYYRKKNAEIFPPRETLTQECDMSKNYNTIREQEELSSLRLTQFYHKKNSLVSAPPLPDPKAGAQHPAHKPPNSCRDKILEKGVRGQAAQISSLPASGRKEGNIRLRGARTSGNSTFACSTTTPNLES